MFRCCHRLIATTMVLAALTVMSTGAVAGQEVSARATLATLPLDSLQVGPVTAYFSEADRDRATDLASLVAAASARYEDVLDLAFPVGIAALRPEHWFSDIPGIPYAIPWPAMDERLLLVPSSLEVGLMVEGRPPLVARRLVDFVALHEFGHVASKEYFRPGDTADYIPVQWFRELLATYFAWAHIAAADPAWALASRQAWDEQVRAEEPPVLSLDWSFMAALDGRELAAVYEWYQLMLNLRAAELHDRYGDDLLPRLRQLSWDRSATWTTDVVLDELEPIIPEFVAWARAFGSAP